MIKTNIFCSKTREAYLNELAKIMVYCGSKLSIDEQINDLEKHPMDVEEIIDLIDMFKMAAPKKIFHMQSKLVE